MKSMTREINSFPIPTLCTTRALLNFPTPSSAVDVKLMVQIELYHHEGFTMNTDALQSVLILPTIATGMGLINSRGLLLRST